MRTEYNANELLSSQWESLEEDRKLWANVLRPGKRNVVARKRKSMLSFILSMFN